jgi:hypothetical protein
MAVTYNFRTEDYDYLVRPETRGVFRDERNGILVQNPTLDIECYINYIDYLNFNRYRWLNYGYLDLGMMPVAMAPSFMQQAIMEEMLKLMEHYKIQCYAMSPVSVLYKKCPIQTEDLWVFKEDVARVFGFKEDKVTLPMLLREVRK